MIGLAEDYSWALVGEPSGRYLWIRSRTPHLTDETKALLIAKLIAQGYNTKALHWTLQPQARFGERIAKAGDEALVARQEESRASYCLA